MSKMRKQWQHAREKAEAALRSMSDEEDAALTAAAASDPDNPELTAEDFKRMRPFAEVHPELLEAITKMRGRPKLERPKVQVTLRLDADVVESFKAEGQGWQSRINDVLARAAKRRRSIA